MKTEALKERIRGSGLTQRELAKQLGLSRVQLNRKLNGVFPFTAPEIMAMQSAIGLSLLDVIDLFFTGGET